MKPARLTFFADIYAATTGRYTTLLAAAQSCIMRRVGSCLSAKDASAHLVSRALRSLSLAMAIASSFAYSDVAHAQSASDKGILDHSVNIIREPVRGFVGKGTPLCEALLTEARKRWKAGVAQCGVPIDPHNHSFGALSWSPLDPRDNMDLIKRIYAWFIATTNYVPESAAILKEMRSANGISRNLADRIWNEYRMNMDDLIRDGDIQLQSSSIDWGLIGKPSRVLRMTAMSPDKWPHMKKWQTEQCNDESENATRPRWLVFTEVDSGHWTEMMALNYPATSRDVVIWNRRPFLATINHSDQYSLYVLDIEALSTGVRFANSFRGCDIQPKEE